MGDPGSAGSWLILFPVQMGFRLVSGMGTFRMVVFGIHMSRELGSGIGIPRRLELGSLLVAREWCDALSSISSSSDGPSG